MYEQKQETSKPKPSDEEIGKIQDEALIVNEIVDQVHEHKEPKLSSTYIADKAIEDHPRLKKIAKQERLDRQHDIANILNDQVDELVRKRGISYSEALHIIQEEEFVNERERLYEMTKREREWQGSTMDLVDKLMSDNQPHGYDEICHFVDSNNALANYPPFYSDYPSGRQDINIYDDPQVISKRLADRFIYDYVSTYYIKPDENNHWIFKKKEMT